MQKVEREMGNLNSGRYDRPRRFTTEEVVSIDVRQIFRLPWLPGQWSPYLIGNGKRHAFMHYQLANDQIIFGISTGNHIHDIRRVSVTWSDRNFDGRQPYFLCPESHCGKRVSILYLTENKLACRTCSQLAYESQHETKHLRLMRRASKLRKKLGAPTRLLAPIPAKPKRMHHETYEQAVYMIHALELQAVKALRAHLSTSLSRKLGFLDSLCNEAL
jgi:hypothetical protein